MKILNVNIFMTWEHDFPLVCPMQWKQQYIFYLLWFVIILTYEIHMQYFSRTSTMSHIVPNVELPAIIKVYNRNRDRVEVYMVMNEEKVKEKGKRKGEGGAMITS
jgi:hypothetical protein